MRKGYIHYPLAESHSATLNYMDSIDWDKICDNIHKNGVTYFDVSNAIDIFPHLERDKNYSLICYVSSEYHGLWGRVAAVRNCCDRRPRIIQNGHFFGTLFDFPRYAFDPMEAVFNDGTPEGYLEALILSELLSAIPYSRHERDNRDAFISTPPIDLNTHWDLYENLPTWTPLFLEDDEKVVLFVCKRHFENGFGSSNGLDTIYIYKFQFYQTLAQLHKFDIELFNKPAPLELRAWIHADSRYDATCRCCAFRDVRVLVAQEKR